MASHSFAYPLSILAPDRRQHRRLTPDITVSPRHIGMLGECRVYLRHRRADWKPLLFSLAVAGSSAGLWAAFVSSLV